MKYTTILLILLAAASTTLAQSPKKDTVVLSVYNNNQRFMLYPMPFGKDKPDNDFTAEMVLTLDTINVLKDATVRDSTGKFPKRWVTQRKCGKLPSEIKDKVALLYMQTDCDISTQVYNAQQAGALVVIVIHTTDNRDSVLMPKKSGRIRYDDDNKVKIPCFTVRKGIGAMLTQMLPSLVGIQRPKADVNNPQGLVSNGINNPPLMPTAEKEKMEAAKAELELELLKNTSNAPFNQKGWDIAPNPVSNQALLQYNFEAQSDVIVEVFNAAGQLVTNYHLSNTQTGTLAIDVTAWQAGAYNVTLSSGSLREVKRLVVAH